MSDEDGGDAERGVGERPDADESGARDDRRDGPDEPLADVASRVRERTGETRESADPSTRDGPLADVASEVDERRRRDRESDDAFEAVDVGELDGEKLWERLAEGDGPTATVPPGESVAVEDDEWAGRDVRTIPKETCHGCPHFGDPPELACTHDGTAILAMTDADHFRVVDCPVVAEEGEIGGLSVEDVGSDGEDGVGFGDGVAPGDGVTPGDADGDGPANVADGDDSATPFDADGDAGFDAQ